MPLHKNQRARPRQFHIKILRAISNAMHKPILIALLLASILIAGCATTAPQAQANNSTGNASLAAAVATNASSGTTNDSIDFHKAYSDDGKLMVYFFYSRTCKSCQAIGPYVESIGRKYGNLTEWHSFDIYVIGDRLEYLRFFKEFNLPQNRSGTPTILVNNTVLWGRYEINGTLEKIINGSISTAARP
jgi:thiol-disulfide isomerase/thioredoxin